MPKINESKILILATDGYERSELREPLEQLKAKGASVKIASLQMGEIKSWDKKNWGDSVKVDLLAKDAKVADFDALVIPGGQMNPDLLRVDASAIQLVKDFAAAGKTLAAICHGPWLFAEAGIAKGKQLTSYKSIKTDLINAGADWIDKEVVADNAIVTSRSPADLDAFISKIIEEIEEGIHPSNIKAA